MAETKITEWRPDECGSRLGDIVVVGEIRHLKVKCRKCTKNEGRDIYHYLEVIEP